MNKDAIAAVDALLKEAYRLKNSTDDDGPYDQANLEDPRLRIRMLKIAASRAPSHFDLLNVITEFSAEHEKRSREFFELLGRALERRDDLRIFYVINSANNRLTVLARDAACARLFAEMARHIRERRNGKVLVMSHDQEVELRKSGKALGRALREGYPGAVKFVGDNVVIDQFQKVYTPMTVVD